MGECALCVAGKGLRKNSWVLQAPFFPSFNFSITHFCSLCKASEQGNIWKKSSDTGKNTHRKMDDHLCFRIQVKFFQMSGPLHLQMAINIFIHFFSCL